MDVRKVFESVTHKYSPLREKQHLMDGASDITDSEADEAPLHGDNRSRSWRRSFTIYLFIFCAQFVLWWGFTMILWRSSRDQLCTAHTTRFWSPVQKEVDITYHTETFNGSFLQRTPWRGEAGQETDDAWDSLGVDFHAFMLSPEEAARAGVPSGRVMYPEEQGGPGYPVTLEVLHQLHCLNLLRKTSYLNIDYYREQGKGAFMNNEPTLRYHITHCLDNLRQVLMCNADIGLVPFLWWGEDEGIFPDFSREHTCRNFNEIKDWAGRQPIVARDGPKVYPQPGAEIFPNLP